MRPFAFHAPASIDEAVALLSDPKDAARPIAGGTDLVVQMKEARTRFPYPAAIISLGRIAEIQEITFDTGTGLTIGAGVTMTDVATSPLIRRHYPALAEGAGVVGSLQTMNMATIGGNVCNAAPSADTAPPLLVFTAEAVIAGPNGRRTVPLESFFRGPGATALEPGELLTALRLPAPPPNTSSAYQRHTPRKQMDIAVVGVAAVLTVDGTRITRARIALGAVAPTPIRAREAEASLEGREAGEAAFAEAAEAAARECSPIDDLRGSAEFRRHLVRVMTGRMLSLASERAQT